LDVFFYLQEITKGRLRYIFGLLARLMGSLYIGDLTDKITLDIAKPMIMKLARNRIARNNISSKEETILRQAVKIDNATAATIAGEVGNTRQYVGRILKKLEESKLISFKRCGTYKYVEPVLDAVIAYGDN
jgi:DNA-binding transcriptional ArsR family regulator